jgi:plastocyanin
MPRLTQRIAPAAVILAAVGAGLLLHLGGKVNAAETREVEIDNYSFSPGDLTVPAGTTVTWINHDETPHTVASAEDPRAFRSGGLDTDDKFSFTFTKPGTYTYLCTVHPYMTGKVLVTP